MKEKRNPGLHKYSQWSNLIFCLKNTRKSCPKLLWLMGLLIPTGVVISLLTVYLPKAVLQAVSNNKEASYLTGITLFYTLSIAILAALQRYCERMIFWYGIHINTHYQRRIAIKALTADYPVQEEENFRRLQNESYQGASGYFSPFVQIYTVLVSIASGSLGFVVYLGILARLNLAIMLILIVTTAASYFLGGIVVAWTEKHSDEKATYIQKISYLNEAAGDIRAAKDVRVFSMSKLFNKLYQDNLQSIERWYRRYTKKLFGISMADCVLSLLREAVAYAYLIYLVLCGRLTTADFVLYLGMITGSALWLSSILTQLNTLSRINLSFQYLRSFLDYPDRFLKSGGITAKGLLDMPHKIELRNVSYRYPGSDSYALRDINLTLQPGEFLALVGLNGAGKTTLSNLICGLIDPTEGEVLYNGFSVRNFDRTEYYRLIAGVFQQYSLMPQTIAEIVAGSASPDEERVRNALRDGGILEKIEGLPKGIYSPYSKIVYDDGMAFSGGEIQKILLARALYKNAPVIILDEPTAAMDPISESRLYTHCSAMMNGKTVLFISHRLASTRFCKRILLLEKGRIIEEGTHDSLLHSGGQYCKLFETQAKYYREHSDGEAVAQ